MTDPGRRRFLKRLCGASMTCGGAAALAYVLYDPEGPKIMPEAGSIAAVPDFSIKSGDRPVMSIVKSSDRVAAVDKAIDLLGGMERFIKPGDRVVIKPNVAFASPPALGATSRPELVAEVVRLCLARGRARQVCVTDNPINDPLSCFSLSGIGRAAEEAGAAVVLPKKHLFRPVTVGGAKLIRDWPVLFEPLAKADKLIGIAAVKDHSRSAASMCMKNWYGLLGGRRSVFHQDINTIIAELAVMVRPTVVILDAVEVMAANGPTGGSVRDLKRADTLIASCDQVAADSYACSFLGLKPGRLRYLAAAAEKGAGTTDYESHKPLYAEVTS